MPVHPALPWLVESIARLERAGGLRGARLTEPGHERWHRIRRKLGWADFVALLCEDLADAFPHPFAVDRWLSHLLTALRHDEAEAVIQRALDAPDDDSAGFLRRAARELDLPSGGALSDLPKVQSNHRVLELAGGRIAVAQVQAHAGLSFHDGFTFVADSDAERALIGLAAVELRANAPTIWTSGELATSRNRSGFDHVFGLRGYGPADRAAALGLEVRWA